MQLSELTIRSGPAVVRTIKFKPGLNLILDKPIREKTQSGNNVGKTTVLRLIDFCLGSDGDDIWQDSEFKGNMNREIYDFLHGVDSVSVDLSLEDTATRGRHVITRSFNAKKGDARAFVIDGVSHTNITEYRAAVRGLLFHAGGTRPTLRQLAPKFVRSSPKAMGKTLKFLGEYGSESDYEALHLFLFGFFAVEVLEERPRLQKERKRLERDMQALTRMRNEGEIEQLLLHLRGEVEDLTLSTKARSEVPEIAAHADRVSSIRSRAANLSASLGGVEAEANAITLAIAELKSEYSDIDRLTIERIYKDAQRYIPKLQHDWSDLTHFIQNLRGRKERFLQSQADDLETRAGALRADLDILYAEEKAEIGELVESKAFNEALEVRGELQDKLKRLGSLEQDLTDIRILKEKIVEVETLREATREQIEEGKAKLRENVAAFNRYFSKLSKELYGEEYLLHFDVNDHGTTVFRLSSVGANVGSGKKMSQTAAFDLAYIEFLRTTAIPFPTFVCHDGLESIHGNQLSALLRTAAALNGQLIVATLRDKLPTMSEGFIAENTVLELSQDDKLFGI